MNSTWKRSVLIMLITLGIGACVSSSSSSSRQATTPRTDPLRTMKAAELFAFAEQYAAGGDTIRAEQYYRSAMDRGYSEDKVVPRLIAVCIRSSRYDIALLHALTSLENHPKRWRLRLVVAALQAALGDVNMAERELRRVLLQQEDVAEAHFALAELLWEAARGEAARPKPALEHLNRYLELEPSGPHASDAQLMLLAAKSESSSTLSDGSLESLETP